MEKLEYLNELQVAAGKLIHSYGVLFLVTLFLKWVASFAAILLLILDGTKWKSTNMWTSLLAPYLFVSLPLVLFQFLRTEFMKWIALLTIILKLFLPNQFPESLEVPGATFLLTVAAPNFFMETFRDDQTLTDPANVCFLTSFYLFNNHTKACGGYKNSFTQKDKIPYTICLCLITVYSLCFGILSARLFNYGWLIAINESMIMTESYKQHKVMEKFEYLIELQLAAEKLINSYGVILTVTLLLKWVASFATILLMILDGTKWKSTNMYTSVLALYLFGSLPLVIFQFLRTEFMKWIALLTVVFKLFLPNHFPESLDVPGATLLLTMVAPNILVEAFRGDVKMTNPVNLCLFASCYLLDKHTKACGGYKNSFTQKDKITYTICLYLLFAYPLWCFLANLF